MEYRLKGDKSPKMFLSSAQLFTVYIDFYYLLDCTSKDQKFYLIIYVLLLNTSSVNLYISLF